MRAMKDLRMQVGELLAADDTTLAPAADGNTVVLIKEDFADVETLVAEDLVPADFTGSTPLVAGTGTQLCGVDPATGQQVVTIKEPAGGWRFEATNDTNLPQTIYGYGLFNDDQTVLLGVQKLAEPITISEAGQEINLGSVQLRINEVPFS